MPSKSFPRIPRTTPRISVTKLGEYTDATPARRRTIVRDQRDPSDFIVVRYKLVRPVLVDHFVAGATNSAPIAARLEALASMDPAPGWEAQDLQLSVEALEAFRDITNGFSLETLTGMPGAHDPPKLPISGVDVSVRPDVVLRGTYRGKSVVGALKFHFAKTNHLTADAGLNIATVLHQYVETHLLLPGEVASARHCAVLDTFAKVWYRAPTAITKRRQTVTDACQEIALWWVAA